MCLFVQVLARNPRFRLSLVKDYVARQLQADSRCVCGGWVGMGGACPPAGSCFTASTAVHVSQPPLTLKCLYACSLPAYLRSVLSAPHITPLPHCHRRSIRADSEEADRLKAAIEETRAAVERLQSEPVVFQSSRDSQTNAPLELPSGELDQEFFWRGSAACLPGWHGQRAGQVAFVAGTVEPWWMVAICAALCCLCNALAGLPPTCGVPSCSTRNGPSLRKR